MRAIRLQFQRRVQQPPVKPCWTLVRDWGICLLLLAGLISSCAAKPAALTRVDGLTNQQAAALEGIKKVDEYPLYTMRYPGDYPSPGQFSPALPEEAPQFSSSTYPSWGCSLFAALGDIDQLQFGRNFDWNYSPALLLFTEPGDGYDSLSMVDMAYFGFDASSAGNLTDLPLEDLKALLEAPFLPFDGINEAGLVIAMAAVPPRDMERDPGKESIGSIRVMREILDTAASVEEAVSILERYNIEFEGGPSIHYLIADATGGAVLVEYYGGEMIVIPNQHPWHQATNFLVASSEGFPVNLCWRYDRITQKLTESGGILSPGEALLLLEDVSDTGTQWSVVYSISTGEIRVVMGRNYSKVHTFSLEEFR